MAAHILAWDVVMRETADKRTPRAAAVSTAFTSNAVYGSPRVTRHPQRAFLTHGDIGQYCSALYLPEGTCRCANMVIGIHWHTG